MEWGSELGAEGHAPGAGLPDQGGDIALGGGAECLEVVLVRQILDPDGEVPARLGVTDASGSTGGQTSGSAEPGLKVGDVVDFKGTQHYTSAAAKDAKTCKPGKATITAVAAGKAHPYHLKAVSGGGSTVYGWVNAADISTGSTGTATSYRVRTTADVLNIRKGPGTNYGVAGQIKGKGIYTIVAEAAGPGATKWGKLKSGAGWISLDYVTKL